MKAACRLLLEADHGAHVHVHFAKEAVVEGYLLIGGVADDWAAREVA